jgi:hypothetical protein
MGISILTHPSTNKSDIDFYVGTTIMAVTFFVVGFGIGFIWRKFKPTKETLVQESIVEVYDEKLWEKASVELDSDARNVGLWAKSFAEANGDEAKAKAMYLKETVKKLSFNIVDSYKDEKITDNNKPNASEQAENESFIIKMGRILLPLLGIFMVLVLLIF